MDWFWYFVAYSFLGFLLESAYARMVHERESRKCLLAFPLCPVYGLGACAVLLLSPLAGRNPALLFPLGAGACTAVEYGMAEYYTRRTGVSFWDYSQFRGSFRGRICLPFSLIWGLLSLVMVYGIHPAVARAAAAIPGFLTALAFCALLTDMAVSHRLLRRTGDRGCLRWRGGLFRDGTRECREAGKAAALSSGTERGSS